MIGRRLYIGETTVKTHVSRVLAKLDLRSRVCYGWGFGLAERLSGVRPWWVPGAWFGVVGVLMLASTWWLRYFDRGPAGARLALGIPRAGPPGRPLRRAA